MSLFATLALLTLAAAGIIREQKPIHAAYAIAAVLACAALFLATASPV